jgi:glutaminase
MRCMRDDKSNTDGKNSQIYPALAQVSGELFGLCVVGTHGEVHYLSRRVSF